MMLALFFSGYMCVHRRIFFHFGLNSCLFAHHIRPGTCFGKWRLVVEFSDFFLVRSCRPPSSSLTKFRGDAALLVVIFRSSTFYFPFFFCSHIPYHTHGDVVNRSTPGFSPVQRI